MKFRAVLFILALAPPLFQGSALADTPPSVWDRAKDPSIGKTWDVHLAVQGWFAAADVARMEARERQHLHGGAPASFAITEGPYYERAVRALENANAGTSSDVRLRFDYGLALLKLNRYVEAGTILRDALAMAPNHPMATDGMHPAWLNYSFANAYLENAEEERRGYERFLAHATEAPERLVPMLNLAEAEMHLGDLTEAARGYEATRQLAASLPNEMSMETGILATWGLAVALDRAGDFGAAARAAESAVGMDPPPASSKDPYLALSRLPASYAVPVPDHKAIILDETSVFFVPSYERKWYLALGETVLAKRSADPRVSLFHWRAVEKFWTDYVTDSRAHKGDRFLASAEKRLEAATKQRKDLEKRTSTLKDDEDLRVRPPPRGIFIE
jgi:tetratricopeptide (TPR) repeat protein